MLRLTILSSALLACCSREAPPPRPERPAPRPDASAAPAPDAAAALLRHGEHLFWTSDPLPGRRLRLLFGGPPYRLCEVADLAAPEARAACTDLSVEGDQVELVSLDDDAPAAFLAGSTLPRGPVRGADGSERLATDAFAVYWDAEGPLAGLHFATPERLEVLRFGAGPRPDARPVTLDADGIAELIGDRVVLSRGGRLRARRVLRGTTAFGPEEDLAASGSTVRGHLACRMADGTVAAVVLGQLSRSVPNVGRVDAAGPVSVLFAGATGTRVVTTEVPARPSRVSCDGDALSMTWVKTGRRMREQQRRHELTRVRCTPDGCETATTVLEGFVAHDPPAVELGGRVLFVHVQDRAVRLRLAPVAELPSAPERTLVEEAQAPTRVDLFARTGGVGVLVDYPDRSLLFAVGPDGRARPVATTQPQPPLPSGIARYGGG